MTRILCKGLLIDMDGVLVDSTPAVARAWRRWSAKYHLDAEWVTKRAHGRTTLATLRDLLPHAGSEQQEADSRWLEQLEMDDVADVTALLGTRELLASAPSDQVTVVTSATRPLAEIRLRAAGLLDLVRHMVTANDIQRAKPDPQPYQCGAAKLQLAPHDCVVIEDAPNGVRSGKAAGARVIAVRTTMPDDELLQAGADWIVNDCASFRVTKDETAATLLIKLVDDGDVRRIPKMS